ncbi:MAG TPA: hypothetical protein DDW28_00605 [Prevotella sp.]|nr:hypothetical protein [Candidatus Segatella violae]
MKRYIYNYQTVVGFSQPVMRHAILLRAQPVQGAYMNVEEEHLLLPPAFHVQSGTDAFGNRLVYGLQEEAHQSLVTVSTGIVGMKRYSVPLDTMPLMVYREPTPLTFLSEEHRLDLEGSIGCLSEKEKSAISSDNILVKAWFICHYVYRLMNYVPQVTSLDTPASEIIKTHQGVCQDYAHLMIALCRLHGIPARYVCGFMEGEGETHAWVEVCDGDAWHGFDPTHNMEIECGYVKLAHGRDASDCPVSRGLYMGNALQETEVSVTLKEI